MQKLKLIFLVVILVLVGSCKITKSMWDKSYEEVVDSFITTADGREFAFIGQNYHYIFSDNSAIIKRILFWKRHDILYIDVNQTYLEVDTNNDVSGYITVKSAFSDLESEDDLYLQSLGFVKQKNGDVSLKLNLIGKRYLANNQNYGTFPLSKPYNFTIHYRENSLFETIGKAALSPITLTLDAIIWVGYVITFPLLQR